MALYLPLKGVTVVFKHFKMKKALKLGKLYRSIKGLILQSGMSSYMFKRKDFLKTLPALADKTVDILNQKPWGTRMVCVV